MLILIVDDDKDVQILFGTMLKRGGIDVMPALNAVEAFDRLAESLPDVIIMDLKLPGKNGIETTALIKQDARYQHIPIVFLSAAGDADVKQRALAAGAEKYLMKPIHPQVLIAEMKAFQALV